MFDPFPLGEHGERLKRIEEYLRQLNTGGQVLPNLGGPVPSRDVVPESDVAFDDSTGHDHTGADGHGTQIKHTSLSSSGGSALLDGARHSDTVSATPVKGDLAYGNATPVWDRLPIGSTGQVIQVSGGVPTWVWYKTELSGWARGNVNSEASGSFTAMKMPSIAATSSSTDFDGGELILPYAGYLLGIVLETDTAIGAGTQYDAQIYINGSGVGSTVRLDGNLSSNKHNYTIFNSAVAFSAGDLIVVRDKQATGSPGTMDSKARVLLTYI